MHAPLDRSRPRRGARDRRAACGAGCRDHPSRYCRCVLPRRTRHGAQRTPDREGAGVMGRGSVAHPRGDEGRADPAARRLDSGRPRPASRRGRRGEPAGARGRPDRSVSVARARSARPVGDERARARWAEARRRGRRDRLEQRHRRTDRRGAAHHRDCVGAGGAEPVAGRGHPRRRGRLLHGARHPAARLSPGRRTAAAQARGRRQGDRCRRASTRRDAVRHRHRLAARSVARHRPDPGAIARGDGPRDRASVRHHPDGRGSRAARRTIPRGPHRTTVAAAIATRAA